MSHGVYPRGPRPIVIKAAACIRVLAASAEDLRVKPAGSNDFTARKKGHRHETGAAEETVRQERNLVR